MLYTVDFEYKGGTYLAQVQAAVLEDVLRLWLEQTPDTELARWSVDRLAIAQSIAEETPVAVQGLNGVWCVSGTVDDSFALVNIIATREAK